MHYKGYLIDLDGTIYKGKSRIPAGEAFVHELQAREIPLSLCDQQYNPHTRDCSGYAGHSFQYKTPVLTIYTATLATIDYMNDQNLGKRSM